MVEAHSFGYWLRLKRKALDLTREALADRVGCSAATIQKLEEEERRPSTQIAERLAEIFSIPTHEQTDFLRFARGDLRFAPAETKEDFPWRTSSKSTRSNLPAPVTSLVGREKEISDIPGYLLNSGIRLVTLIGPPGIGKTRLSIEAARAGLTDFPDGVFFVALAPLDDPNLIAPALVQALGYVGTKNISTTEQLKEGIGDKILLIVLDNCEHLIEDVSSLASGLLSACSRLKILTTSREALHVPGEWLYSVPTLGMPKEDSAVDMETLSKFPALTLFAERARAVRSDFELDSGNVQAIASICAQLDGLPLAIELIAARMRLMSPQVLLERWNDQFMLSADGMRAVSTRQKTLNNAISWSYNLLSDEEQRLFAHLSVFSGGFTLAAAEAIFSRIVTGKSVTDLIASLLDKSLLQRPLDREAHGEPHFHMLVTIQQFAMDRLRQMGEEAEVRNWHLEYFLDLAEKGDKEIRGPSQIEWANRLEREHDNFRAALEWSVSNYKTESALRMLCALGWPWEIRGRYSEARNWLDKIRRLPDVNNYPAIYARLLNHIGRHSWTQHLRNDAHSLLEESKTISAKLGDDGEQILAEALNWLGLVVRSDGDSKKAEPLFKRGLELYQKWENQSGVALSTFHLGVVESQLNHDDVALSLLEKSLSLFRQLGDLFFTARVSLFLGYLFLKQGNYDKARLFFEEHLRIDKELQFWDGIADGLRDLGNLYSYQGKYDQASQYYEESVTVCREHGLNKYHVYYSSGLLALRFNNYARAFQRFTYLLDLARKSGEKVHVSILLMALAAVAGGTIQSERAAKLNGAAQAVFETIDDQIPLFDRAEFDRHIQIACDQLGDSKFEALAAEGRAMTMEQAVAFALEKNDG